MPAADIAKKYVPVTGKLNDGTETPDPVPKGTVLPSGDSSTAVNTRSDLGVVPAGASVEMVTLAGPGCAVKDTTWVTLGCATTPEMRARVAVTLGDMTGIGVAVEMLVPRSC